MAFLHPKLFQTCDLIGANDVGEIWTPGEVWTPAEIMIPYWKLKKVRYTYNWNYGDGTVFVNGSGSKIMSGGKDKKSDYVCPSVHTFGTTQDVTYSYDGETEATSDQVLLEVDTNYVAVNQNDQQTYPYMKLSITLGRLPYRVFTCAPYQNDDTTADVEFFDKPGITFGLGTNYSISIQIDLEEETENA
jgi:hypothetical protein